MAKGISNEGTIGYLSSMAFIRNDRKEREKKDIKIVKILRREFSQKIHRSWWDFSYSKQNQISSLMF